jgi:hypothetical protein
MRRAVAIPAGAYPSIIARTCLAAVLGERGLVTEAKATLDALAATVEALPDHPLSRVLQLASLHCDLGVGIARAERGDLVGGAAAVAKIHDVLARSIADRPLEHPDVRIWRVFIRHSLERNAVLFGTTTCRLEVDARGRWFRRDGGDSVRFGSKPVLRRLLSALTTARVDAPGRTISTDELIASSWPGERMAPRSALRRLQVAISRLRDLGLAGIIHHDADGYLLAPSADVTFSSQL